MKTDPNNGHGHGKKLELCYIVHEDPPPDGHPPIANRTICIDFDGTIVPWGKLMAPKHPFPGVGPAIRALKAEGYTIVIFTSRLSMTWLVDEDHDPDEQYAYVAGILERNSIPYDRITSEKVPAEAYFDDKAITVSADMPLAVALMKWLTTERAA